MQMPKHARRKVVRHIGESLVKAIGDGFEKQRLEQRLRLSLRMRRVRRDKRPSELGT